MNTTKKELKKSLKQWKNNLKQVNNVLNKEPEDSFMHETLSHKKEEMEAVIKIIERQLGVGNEQASN